MHRTQLLLEESQYQALRELARRDGKSMGQLVRELLANALKRRESSSARRRADLGSLKGMFHKPGVRGRDHDKLLYGEK